MHTSTSFHDKARYVNTESAVNTDIQLKKSDDEYAKMLNESFILTK